MFSVRIHTLRVAATALLAVAGPVAPARAGTYYLAPGGNDSAGTGTRQQPWKTVQYAVSRVPDDGSIVVLLDGLYEGAQSIGRQCTKTCTIRAENPYHARLRSGPNGNRVLSCYDAANVRIEGLEIFGSGGTQGEYVVHVGTTKAHHLTFDNCIIHDCYNNDLIKVNDGAHHILFRNCVIFNQPDHGGDQHFDVNTVTDIEIDGCILFNDFAGSGRQSEHRSQGFIVVKNSGSTPNFTRRIALRRNIFLNWDGAPDQSFLLLGEDGKPFFEAQEVMIENNLFIHNSPIRTWGTLLYKGGLKNITFRANTVVGHPAVKWTGAESAVCIQIEKNPPMGDLLFCNNIWCDPTGQMPRFSISNPKTFAPGAKLLLNNNLYWNAGKPIPREPQDVLTPERDAKQLVADPRLPAWDATVTLPRWDPSKGRFLSGARTIREEFERLVRLYAAIAPNSPAVDAADPACMPADDILGKPRDRRPDIGCFERPAEQSRP